MLSHEEKLHVAEMLADYGDRRAGYLGHHSSNFHGDNVDAAADRDTGSANNGSVTVFQYTRKSTNAPLEISIVHGAR